MMQLVCIGNYILVQMELVKIGCLLVDIKSVLDFFIISSSLFIYDKLSVEIIHQQNLALDHAFDLPSFESTRLSYFKSISLSLKKLCFNDRLCVTYRSC